MIEPIKGLRGQEQALCKCDECASEVVVNAAHGDTRGFSKSAGGRNGRPVITIKNEGQVTAKLQGDGWAFVKGKLICPKCDGKRKAERQEAKVAAVVEIRTPTREQKRQIMDLLTEVYDTKAGRYRGAETDVTVADTIGGGVMFGWVAQLRSEFFGESGENEEAEDFLGQIAEWQATVDKAVADAQAAIASLAPARAKVAEIEARMRAFQKAMGPKGVKA